MGMHMMTQSPEQILKRIDAIIYELQALRLQILTLENRSGQTSINIVDELAGSLGQGDLSEYDSYSATS